MPISQPSSRRLQFAYPPRGILLVGSVLIYLVVGAVGHDPWKGDDAVHIGVIKSMLETGDWLVPQLAGEVFTDYPPLYFWIGKLTALSLGGLLPLHDAARLASVLCGGVLFAALGASAHTLLGVREGESIGATAVMIGLGTLGFLVPFHEAQPMLAVLAALSLACYGLAKAIETPWHGGLLFGAGLGLTHLAGGFNNLLYVAPLALLLPLVSPAWRERNIVLALLGGLLVAAAIAIAHSLLLLAQDPGAQALWLDHELDDLAPKPDVDTRLSKLASTIPWFAWPALPLACWSLWAERRNLQAPAVMLPLMAFLLALLNIVISGGTRDALLLPLVPPLILLATCRVGGMRRGLANAFDWFGMMSMTFFMFLVWVGYLAMASGWPPRLARQVVRLEPGFELQLSLAPLALGIIFTACWLALILAGTRSTSRGAVHWAVGTITFWALAMILWMPWIDYGRSYRMVSDSLAAALGEHPAGCIAARDLGETQRASFYYFSGIVTQREIVANALPCRLLLAQQTGRDAEAPPGDTWRKVWEDRRRGDRNEMYRLYVRDQHTPIRN
ncbi:MAG: hypothetical protein IPJ21_07700 [Sterolibacteriaceae bacterium]|nr:hypothetical protein [Sterolibacteriaceae bacterium]MBK9083750.1 hypothetical protein [Sterolibacteriaceae bacterium]